MSKRPSASFNDPGFLYNQRLLLKLFTLSSAALMVGILWTIWQDFDREWKDEQRAETKLEAGKFALEKMILETQSRGERATIEKERRRALKNLKKRQDEIDAVRARIEELRGDVYDLDSRYKGQKQYTQQAEYRVNEAKSESDRELWAGRLREERDREHRARDAVRLAQDELSAEVAKEKKLQSELDAVIAKERASPELKRIDLLAAGIEKKRSYSPLREVPLLDFLAPPTRVEQVVLDHLVDNYEFALPKKVDRCGTCHVGAMRIGFEPEKWPVEILEGDYAADPTDPRSGKARVFEEAVYRFVFDLVSSVTKPERNDKYQLEVDRNHAAAVHHKTLEILFEDYDPESGEIGVHEKGPKKGRKIWRRWRWSKKKNRWVKDSKKGSSIAEFYLALLKKMKRHWRTHRHFADMVGDASPHPYERFGCTTCHLGRGWSVDFGFAYHMPDRKRIEDWMTSKWAERHDHHDPASARVSLETAMARGNTGTTGDIRTGWVLDHERGHEWESELGWTHEKTHYWLWPQHPKMLVQSSCLKCHKEGLYETPEPEYADIHLGMPDVNAPDTLAWEDHAESTSYDAGADAAGEYAGRMFIPKEEERYRPKNLEKGLDSFLRFGCHGCHKLDPKVYPFMETERPKVGPPLDEIAAKTTNEFLLKWVRNPKDYRENTRMPRFWGLSNNSHDFRYRFSNVGDRMVDGKAWADAEIYAIVEWISEESRKRARQFPEIDLATADPKRGARLVAGDYAKSEGLAKACIACHDVPLPENLAVDARRMEAWVDKESGLAGGWKDRMSRRQGPNLAGIGSKVDKNWLYAWLRDPRGYWHDTNMPDLRLTDQEALDITAYLMTLRNEAFEKLPGVGMNDLMMQWVAEELKVAEQKESASRAIGIVAEWAKEDPRKVALYVGEKLVKHYGCFGCHQIEAYAETTPIGTELTEWGSKLIARLEFNHAPIDRTRFDFAFTKLINPRIYDRGMARADRPLERLRMPRFVFAPEEARDLATFLIGLVNDPIPERSLFDPDERQADIVRGRQVIRRYNCQGCHMIEGRGGDIWPGIEQPAFRPPNLLGQGLKTNPAWLFRFMKNPAFVQEYSPPGEIRIRPWHSINMPDFGLTDEEGRAVVRYFAALSGVMADFESTPGDSLTTSEGPYPKTFQLKDPQDPERKITVSVDNRFEETEVMFREYACKSCHSDDPSQPITNRAPNFRHTRNGRLREDWITIWLWGPYKLQPGTKMPTFFGKDAPKPQDARFFQVNPGNPDLPMAKQVTAAEQIRALRDYIRYHYKDN